MPKLVGAPKAIDVWDAIKATETLCAKNGKHREYHLNEFIALEAYAKKHGRNAPVFSSFENSRAMIEISLPAEVAPEINFITGFIHEVRVDEKDDPNNLVMKVWRGLSDTHAVAATCARGFRWVSAIKIADFFINRLATRAHLRSIMDKLRAVYVQWSALTSMSSPPGMLDLAEAVLAEHPEWRAEYNGWLAHEKPAMLALYEVATAPENWPAVAAHLNAGAEPMITTHDRNVDDDYSSVAGAENMPVKSCMVESVFATLDITSRQMMSGGTSITTLHGVTMARYSQAYLSMAEKKKKWANRKRKKAGELDREEDDCWSLVSYFDLPVEERDRLLAWCAKHAGEQRESEATAKAEAGEAKLERLQLKKAGAAQSALNATLAWERWNKHPLAQSVQELEDLVAKADGAKAKAEAYRDQIRARLALCEVKRTEVPKLGDKSDTTSVEMARLEKEVGELVTKGLQPIKSRPLPLTMRKAHDAATEQARSLEKEHLQAVLDATHKFYALMQDGVLRFTHPDVAAAHQAAGGGSASGSPDDGHVRFKTGPRTGQCKSYCPCEERKRWDAMDQAMQRKEFDKESEKWRILKLKFDADAGSLVVYYYNITSRHTHSELEEDLEHEDVHKGAVTEVIGWVRATEAARRRVG